MVDYIEKTAFLIFSMSLTFMVSCTTQEPQETQNSHNKGTRIDLKYARQFEVWQKEDILEVVVDPGSAYRDQEIYTLLPAGTSFAGGHNNNHIIEVPVKNLVLTSTSHLPFLSMLGSSEYLTGFPNTNYITSASIRKRIEQGLIKDVGTVSGINYETLISLQPGLVVTYASGSDLSDLDQLDQSGIPYVLLQDFMEESPLGRAEWIKFMGLLTGKYYEADSVFREIERNYLELRKLTGDAQEKPTVFSGILYGDTWFAPGADSFAAKFIEHAGGDYTWSDFKGSGSIELSLEAVVDRNMTTQFWIGTGEYTSKTALEEHDPRYANFQAFQTDQVYNYHGSIGPTGGFEYFELGGARPDLVLSDLISILHPGILPDHQLYFYKKLD